MDFDYYAIIAMEKKVPNQMTADFCSGHIRYKLAQAMTGKYT